jgi:hypothetical protein
MASHTYPPGLAFPTTHHIKVTYTKSLHLFHRLVVLLIMWLLFQCDYGVYEARTLFGLGVSRCLCRAPIRHRHL